MQRSAVTLTLYDDVHGAGGVVSGLVRRHVADLRRAADREPPAVHEVTVGLDLGPTLLKFFRRGTRLRQFWVRSELVLCVFESQDFLLAAAGILY